MGVEQILTESLEGTKLANNFDFGFQVSKTMRISSVVLSYLVLWYLVLHYSNPRKLLHRKTFSFFPLLFFFITCFKNITIKFIKRNYHLSIMSSFMADEVRATTKGLPTFFTVIRFLTSVNSLMSSKG